MNLEIQHPKEKFKGFRKDGELSDQMGHGVREKLRRSEVVSLIPVGLSEPKVKTENVLDGLVGLFITVKAPMESSWTWTRLFGGKTPAAGFSQ